MNLPKLVQLLFGIRKDADSDIKTIKAGAFDRICAELDRAQFESAEMDELLNAVNTYNCEGSPVPEPVVVAPEGPFYVLMTPEAAPENTPPAAPEEPAAPIPAEDPGAAPRRRGRPRKPTIEAPNLLPTPDAPAPEPVPEPTAEPVPEPASEPSPGPTGEPAEDDIPW